MVNNTEPHDIQELMSYTKYSDIRFDSVKYQKWFSMGVVIITFICLIYAMVYKRTRSLKNFCLFVSVIAYQYESYHWGRLEVNKNWGWSFMFVQVGIG